MFNESIVKIYKKQVEITREEFKKRGIYEDPKKSFLLYQVMQHFENYRILLPQSSNEAEESEKYMQHHSRISGILDQSNHFIIYKTRITDDLVMTQRRIKELKH